MRGWQRALGRQCDLAVLVPMWWITVQAPRPAEATHDARRRRHWRRPAEYRLVLAADCWRLALQYWLPAHHWPPTIDCRSLDA